MLYRGLGLLYATSNAASIGLLPLAFGSLTTVSDRHA